MQLDTFFQYVYGFFDSLLARPLQGAGIALGPGDWFFLIYTIIFIVIIGALVRRGGGGGGVPEGVRTIIASTGDVSAGMTGIKKVSFLRTPSDAIVFLKVEENAIQQALMAVGYYAQQGAIDENMKLKLESLYQSRLETVRSAIAKESDLKEIVETSTAVDKARSDYLRKMAAMSGTAVETDTAEAGPSSVGMPGSVAETTTAPATGPSTGPPSGGAPEGGPPGGGAPSGGPPGGGAPGGGPPGGAPSGAAAETAAEPVGDSGPPGGAAPPGDAPKKTGEKSTLQSEMLAEMERLRALMSGD